MRAIWRWTMWITFLRHWPAMAPSQQRPTLAANTAPICCNRTPATPSSTVSLYLSAQDCFQVLFYLIVLSLLKFSSFCVLYLCSWMTCMKGEFDSVPLVILNCVSHNILHSSHDWPHSSWKCAARLSLLANICGQRLPYRSLPRPTVCEFNKHIFLNTFAK